MSHGNNFGTEIMGFGEGFDDVPNLATRFEAKAQELIDNPPPPDAVTRQCRTMVVPDGIENTKPGEYTELVVAGGGWCAWYYYVSLRGEKFLMFVHPDNTVSGHQINYIPESFSPETEMIRMFSSSSS